MIELTTAHKANLERFQQNIDLRVLLFKRAAGSAISRALTNDGAYQLYIQLTDWRWVYSIRAYDSVVIGRYTIYWSDNPKDVAIASIASEHWYPLISNDSMGFKYTLSFDYIKDDNGSPSTADKTHVVPPLYAKYLKIVYTDNIVTAPNAIIYSEDYFDITDYLVSEITRTKRMDKVVRHYQRPTAEIFLDNSDGLFNKRNTSSPYYLYLKSGTRFTIDAKFMGAAWEDPAEWIPMGSYRAKKFSKNDNAKVVSMYGEAGRQLTLQKTTQRIFEQVPVRKFAEYFLKDDQQQKPVCALLPRKTQVRTMVDEELGIGRFNDVEYEKGMYNAFPSDEFLCSCCSNQDGDFWVCGQSIAVVLNENFYPKPYRIIINGSEIFIESKERQWGSADGVLDLKLSVTADEDNIFLMDMAASAAGLHPAAFYIAKLNYKTGRIEKDFFGILMGGGFHYGIGVIHKDINDKLYCYYKLDSMGDNEIFFDGVNKTTLLWDSTSTSITDSRLVNCIIYDGFYNALDDKFYFILSEYDTSSPPVLQKQYLMKVDSGFVAIEEMIEIMNISAPDNVVRMGIMVRNNKDYVASIKDGTDSWFFTFAKRQFWLKGNIQDTNGPMTDTVFYDQPEIYQDQEMDNTGVWDDYVVETDDYWLNTKTGELILKRPLKEDARLWANYDYYPSLNFPEIEDMMRYAALQQAAETENWRAIIDERENVNLKERIFEEVIPTMDFSETTPTILTFVSDPVVGLPDEIRTENLPLSSAFIYSPTGGTFFDNVQKFDEIIITGGDPGNLGTYMIQNKVAPCQIEVYRTLVSDDWLTGSIKRYVVTRSPKSVKLGQTYEGKGVGLLNIIHDVNHKTIRVFSMDFLEELIESTDYTIGVSSGYIYINFQDTARVQNNPSVIVQYRIQEELYSIVDTHNVVTETEGWNEDTIINKVIVKGQRLLPDVTRLSIVRQYAVAPYSKQNRSDLPLIQEANSTGQFDWASDDERTDYSEKDVTKQNFLLEFEHPLIIGTTAFTVIYGDEANIEKSDTVEHTKRDAVYYWEITDSFTDANYLVMISNRREFRVCTAEDYRDMVGSSGNWTVDANNDEVGYGTEPTSAGDMKTAAHFYIKQMNGAYAREDTKYVVYYEKSTNWYINDQGIVVSGSITPNEDGQGVFTGYPNKAAAITVTPKDSQGATLFEWHGVNGPPGYKSTGFTDVDDETYALQVTRVQIDSKGANLKFNNWGEIAQYIQVGISGYPLSRVEKINVEADPTAQEITDYGERDKEIENLFIGETYQARSLAFGLRNFFKDEKSKFSTAIILAPHLQLEDIVEVTNPYEYLDTKLMEILEVVDHIRIGGASTSGLVMQEVEDDA